MTIDRKLLEILRCPVTKQAVGYLVPDDLEKLNQKISDGQVSHHDGSPVTTTLSAALVTENHRTIYKIEDDIPIMLEDLSINAEDILNR